jgi:hypothetical protein
MRPEAALLLLAACATAAPVAQPEAAADLSTCDGMILEAAAEVHESPGTESPMVARLPAGQPILSCGESAGWRAIRYPRPGERADCATRAPETACPTGYISATAPALTPD